MVKFTIITSSISILLSIASGASSAPAPNATSPASSSSKFIIPSSADNGANLIANVDDPAAVNPQSVCPGYKATHVLNTTVGLTATLRLAGKPCNVYGMDVEWLNLTVEYQARDRVNVHITPTYVDASNASWYLLPEELVPRSKSSGVRMPVSRHDLFVDWSNEPTFNFKVIRRSNGDVLFNTGCNVLVYENQFIEFGTSLPWDYNLYGLGERFQNLRLLNNTVLTTYAADKADPIDSNMYGSHPFYMDTRYFEVQNKTTNMKEYVSYSHGVFLRNSHGQEVILHPCSLTWRTLGGSIDLTFYGGPSPAEVTRSYQTGTVGLPAMQQYFTLGYHQCRWGYTNWSVLNDVVDNFEKFGLSLDNIWTDIGYMNGYRDFENDPNRFGYREGAMFLSKLHNSGRHYIPIVDSAIYIPNPENKSDAYDTYNRGTADDVWIKNPDGSTYIGAVWPGYTVFPDWHHPKAVDFWANELLNYFRKVAYDGIWIDMSEVSSFCVGSCGSHNLTLNPAQAEGAIPGEPGNLVLDYPEGFELTNKTEAAYASAAVSSSQAAAMAATATATTAPSSAPSYLRTYPTPGMRNVNYPPYVINNVEPGHDLAAHAISPNATHADGMQEYDVHNLFGHQILYATYEGLRRVFPGRRPFIIGRSTFAGSGKWAGHWGGDNRSKWAHMYFSISQALSFSLYGIPMFGADTCGFNGNSDEELCNRWMQLSAFFPFYRNHNVISANAQEPYQWASVIEASKKAMTIRYSILPYLYTLMYLAHTTGSTVMRALAWEFPRDPSLAHVDTQFLLGPAIMVIPVLEPQTSTVRGVFPDVANNNTIWYDWYTQRAVPAKPNVNTTIPAPLGHIPVYVRSGSIIPRQGAALTTQAARNTPWSLLVALDKNGHAGGRLYIDDGVSVRPNATLHVELGAGEGVVVASPRGTWRERNPLSSVTVMGVSRGPRPMGRRSGSGPGSQGGVTVNGQAVPASEVRYDAGSRVLSVGGLEQISMAGGGAWGQRWVLRW